MTTLIQKRKQKLFTPLQFLQQHLDRWEIEQEQTARRIVELIPDRCPFEREIRAIDWVKISRTLFSCRSMW